MFNRFKKRIVKPNTHTFVASTLSGLSFQLGVLFYNGDPAVCVNISDISPSLFVPVLFQAPFEIP